MSVIKLLFMAPLLLFISCKKDNSNQSSSSGKIAPENFSFNTTKEISLNVTLLSNNDEPLKGVPVHVYSAEMQDVSSSLHTSITDANGKLSAKIVVPAYIDTLYIDPSYIGLIRYAKSYISGTSINCTLGGKDGFSGNVVPYISAIAKTGNIMDMRTAKLTGNTKYLYLGSYDYIGKPLYLETPNDVISSDFLARVNASLPESQPVMTTHPTYLSSSSSNIISVTALADVFVTFVSEGAGNLNTLGFYTYATGNPPTNVNSIDTVRYIFPNSSASGSGGGLVAGNKVKLGRFPAGTSIGFVLFPGWNGSSVNTSPEKFYTNEALNPESAASLKRHNVTLYDDQSKLFLIGFEDLKRSLSSCDNDFNDLVFYCSSNPVTAISTNDVAPIDTPTDTDGDGVSDAFDQYPTDPTKAYISYAPSATSWGTLAFEDLWPDTGDYDMNDLVINYRYGFISNAANNVVEVSALYKPIAAGASWDNGFAVQFPFNSSIVQSVTGQRLNNNYIQTNANGTEAGQTKAVVVPFDNYRDIIKNPGNAYFINTLTDMNKVYGDSVLLNIKFTSPVALSTIGTAPFNPFVITQMRRSYEVHLPGKLPTDKFNTALFGTVADNSSIAAGKLFLSGNNWPWAINFIEPFTYPIERNGIQNTYLHFLDWARSGGTSYTDWYSNSASGYRNSSLLYTK